MCVIHTQRRLSPPVSFLTHPCCGQTFSWGIHFHFFWVLLGAGSQTPSLSHTLLPDQAGVFRIPHVSFALVSSSLCWCAPGTGWSVSLTSGEACCWPSPLLSAGSLPYVAQCCLYQSIPFFHLTFPSFIHLSAYLLST